MREGGAETDEEVKKQAQGTIWREGEGVGDKRRAGEELRGASARTERRGLDASGGPCPELLK